MNNSATQRGCNSCYELRFAGLFNTDVAMRFPATPNDMSTLTTWLSWRGRTTFMPAPWSVVSSLPRCFAPRVRRLQGGCDAWVGSSQGNEREI